MSCSTAHTFDDRVGKVFWLANQPEFKKVSWSLLQFCKTLYNVSRLCPEAELPLWFDALGGVTKRLNNYREMVAQDHEEAVSFHQPVVYALCRALGHIGQRKTRAKQQRGVFDALAAKISKRTQEVEAERDRRIRGITLQTSSLDLSALELEFD
ncbi:hypothetical protein BDV93DRAFT_556891 [Ceratobasidium sp. AG-I]|nr:hypothetical protein BDV93DRAFT_556891 [Ceratobasidium sp. AG-I]